MTSYTQFSTHYSPEQWQLTAPYEQSEIKTLFTTITNSLIKSLDERDKTTTTAKEAKITASVQSINRMVCQTIVIIQSQQR